MKQWLGVGHVQFDMWFLNSYQSVTGTMTACDRYGFTVLLENNGQLHSYSWNVLQHVCLAGM